MAKKKEPPLMQEIGPKKYYEKIDAAHKFYDKYKAGRRDPKTGEYYHHISFSDPNAKRTVTGQSLCQIECHDCGNPLSVRTSTVCITCGCGCYHSFDYNRDTGELKVESRPKGGKKYGEQREPEATESGTESGSES